MSRPNGVTLWQGERDGRPFAIIATGLFDLSRNGKIGGMVQLWILPTDIPPHEAAASGDDDLVCFDCPMRPSEGGACYVVTFQAPLAVYKTFHRGRYPAATPDILRGRRVRFGAWGDPCLVPVGLIRTITSRSPLWTGYTRQWKNNPQLAPFYMASVYSEAERREAKALGFRTFRPRLKSEPVLRGEIVCPATPEGGSRTTCSECGLCNGRSQWSDKRADITVIYHGVKAVGLGLAPTPPRQSRLPVHAP